MKQKTFNQIASIIFAVLGAMHLLRLVLGWNANIAGWDVPTFLSIVVVIVAGYLAYTANNLKK